MNLFLVSAGALNVMAAVLHLACIVVGGKMYRFLGAGDGMAKLADAGDWYPTFATLAITAILLVWAAYAFAGAGLFPRPPLLKVGLGAITAFYLLRSAAILPVFVGYLHGRTSFIVAGAGGGIGFWSWSSLICLVYGLVHLAGLIQAWSKL